VLRALLREWWPRASSKSPSRIRLTPTARTVRSRCARCLAILGGTPLELACRRELSLGLLTLVSLTAEDATVLFTNFSDPPAFE
jgi:hypothetical protein